MRPALDPCDQPPLPTGPAPERLGALQNMRKHNRTPKRELRPPSRPPPRPAAATKAARPLTWAASFPLGCDPVAGGRSWDPISPAAPPVGLQLLSSSAPPAFAATLLPRSCVNPAGRQINKYKHGAGRRCRSQGRRGRSFFPGGGRVACARIPQHGSTACFPASCCPCTSRSALRHLLKYILQRPQTSGASSL